MSSDQSVDDDINAARDAAMGRPMGDRFEQHHRAHPFEVFQHNRARIYKAYGYYPESIQQMYALFEAEMANKRKSVRNLTKFQEFCVFLYFIHSGSFLRVSADATTVRASKSTVHRCVKKVSGIIAQHVDEYVFMPNRREQRDIARAYFDKTGLAGVIGCIDGCHIPCNLPSESPQGVIQGMNDGEEYPQLDKAGRARLFVNRHNAYSFNMMAVCDNRKLISAADSRCFWFSQLKTWMVEQLNHDDRQSEPHFLIGDKGYANSSVLVVPFKTNMIAKRVRDNPDHEELERMLIEYNKGLSSGRIDIEHTFGLLKAKFPILKSRYRGRSLKLFYDVVTSCVILHNLAIMFGDTASPEPFEWGEDPERDQLFQECMDALELSEEEAQANPYFFSQEFQGEEDDRIRDRLVEIRAESGPHPGDAAQDSDSSSDDEESEIEDGYYAELDSDVGDSTADEEDDLYT